MTKIVRDFPGYTIVESTGSFVHGDEVAIPFMSRRYGIMYNICKLGSVAGFAKERNLNVEEAIANTIERMKEPYSQHKLYWVNKNPVCISSSYSNEKPVYPQVSLGDVIEFEGKKFVVCSEPNDNYSLKEAE